MSCKEATRLPVALAERPGLKRPSMYQVILLNDDFTPMDFVVDVLCRFFQKSSEDATAVMLNIHHQGRGLCGIYPHGIAETRVAMVNQFSRSHEHPLKCIMEKQHAQ